MKAKSRKSFGLILMVLLDGLNMKRCEISKEHRNPILNTIKTFEKHPSILKIKELSSGCRFSFGNVSLVGVKAIRELDISKASQLLVILTKIIKQNADIFFLIFFVNINHSINNSNFSRAVKIGRCKASFQEKLTYR